MGLFKKKERAVLAPIPDEVQKVIDKRNKIEQYFQQQHIEHMKKWSGMKSMPNYQNMPNSSSGIKQGPNTSWPGITHYDEPKPKELIIVTRYDIANDITIVAGIFSSEEFADAFIEAQDQDLYEWDYESHSVDSEVPKVDTVEDLAQQQQDQLVQQAIQQLQQASQIYGGTTTNAVP